jgi:hypothetical protein
MFGEADGGEPCLLGALHDGAHHVGVEEFRVVRRMGDRVLEREPHLDPFFCTVGVRRPPRVRRTRLGTGHKSIYHVSTSVGRHPIAEMLRFAAAAGMGTGPLHWF